MKTNFKPTPKTQVAELAATDRHHLNAAEGWLDLDLVDEAVEELRQVSVQARFHPRVLRLHWRIASRNQHWGFAHAIAQGLVATCPDHPDGWLYRSQALHAMKRTAEAWQQLLPAALRFPKNALICYHLARYASVLHKFEDARRWLERATSLEEGNKLKWDAISEPDFDPLWKHLAYGQPA